MPISSSGGKGGRSCRSFLCPCPEKTGDKDNKAAVTVASLRIVREKTRPSTTKQEQALIRRATQDVPARISICSGLTYIQHSARLEKGIA